ncbi:PQQ-dependent sugar dehydrogenase [Pseudofulvimonas gallinarii]|uniref:Glucose/arabinose dehydrogenase n=1 Tax=Pseudofulvimonas gallinarii TaxID=634155 RepID=A0A4R3LRS9_9GAMM|nr:PQQ-dependent sugar dehydrogenase [Pseudofulvimonas gallinarii]TCT01255.1 glucose/arabinose dehydrogenase [Pseudofulvimonas gallinarii]
MNAHRNLLAAAITLGLLAACSKAPDPAPAAPATTPEAVPAPAPAAPAADATATPPARTDAFDIAQVTRFDSPWAMTFLPDGRMLVTEMAGTLHLYDPASDTRGSIVGVPEVAHVAQGGLGDIVLHPRFAENQVVYLSFAEREGDLLGSAVARARLALDDSGTGSLDDLQVIWRQVPKKSGDGHFGYRIAFDGDGKLWISSSERKEFDPAQDMASNLGKIVRLNDDGSVPADNPFADQDEVAAQVWSLGHRNILGLAFDGDGRLWAHEMGPMGGDELNLIQRGANYGYPLVSNGDHYDGTPIPDHETRPEFNAPVITWTPVISPAGFMIYDGESFADWRGSGFIGGMSSKSLVRIQFDGDSAREAERFDMGRRIREVEQGPDGAIWLLEDGTRQGGGWLLKLTPR